MKTRVLFNTCKETKPPWLLSKAALFALIKIVFLCVNTVPIKAPVSFNEMLHDLVLGVSKQGAFQTGVFGHVNCFRFLNHLHPKN